MAGSARGPEDLDPATAHRVARTFLVVRMVRGGVLLLFLAIAVVGVEARGWPRGISLALVAVMVLLVGDLVAKLRRHRRDAPGPET